MTTEKQLQIKTLSSLTKVFPERICGRVSKACDAARGQEVAFQVAYRLPMKKYYQKEFTVKAEAPEGIALSLYTVGLVPSVLASYPDRRDPNYITHLGGIFPDPLFPMEGDTVKAAVGVWRTVWVSLRIPTDTKEGVYPVKVTFFNQDGETVAKTTYRVTVHSAVLPAQRLLYTQWFHCDCIADVHGVPVMSEAHWTLMEKYMQLAAAHGMNMILTPVVTPPLDTAVGTERPTVQLVGIEKTGDIYSFDCSLLGRFVSMARLAGIEHFEISHLFTQWGVAHAPKVVATVDGREQKIFGWETDAASEEYKAFLKAFVPAVIAYMKSLGVPEDHIWFHVSDEPHMEHLEAYRTAHSILTPLIEGCHHMDALSDLSFYQEGLLPSPVVATNRIEPYLEANVEGLWCYYCCSQGVDVSNRFFSMPSPRTRIIGVQLYKYRIEGFLQWGYNFYYTQLSKRLVNPYTETDAGEAFPSGDAFTVYPYRDGVIPSLRQKVFANALEDLRLLELLEEKLGRARVLEELERIAGMEITFKSYPTDEGFFEALYRFAFEMLEQ
ncbi:MAG: DUF4091 domain-containing protein [Ruminococcaceae bacterium]|nr:DUF4091 domain-containing protein [Oscillospiraceae bacterium]